MFLTTIISNTPSPKNSLPSRDHSTRAAFNRHNNKIKTSRKNHKHNKENQVQPDTSGYFVQNLWVGIEMKRNTQKCINDKNEKKGIF